MSEFPTVQRVTAAVRKAGIRTSRPGSQMGRTRGVRHFGYGTTVRREFDGRIIIRLESSFHGLGSTYGYDADARRKAEDGPKVEAALTAAGLAWDRTASDRWVVTGFAEQD